MPELPEVEMVRRVLAPQLRGQVIERAEIRRSEMVAHPGAEAFRARLAGQAFADIGRRGKFLLFALESGDRMIVHLRMTGCLLLAPPQLPEEPHTHVVLRLRGGAELRYSDPRRFGRFWLLRAGEADAFSGVGRLGREPFDPGLTAGYLSACLGKRKRAIKSCLMEQDVVAGIGNIYSDEILFAAEIDPARAANRLSGEEWERLAALIPERMGFFVEANGIEPEEYLRTRGQEYRNTPFLQVYGHEGESCPRCGAPLRKVVIAGRGSVSCPRCQK